MRLLAGIAFLMIFQACSQNEETVQTVSDLLRISLDTVRIDSGEEFLYLKNDLYHSYLSSEGDYLINFNQDDFTTEKIDLDDLRLLEKVQFEKEGPNGLGNYVSNFSLWSDENILIWDYFLYKVFDQDGHLVKDLKLDKIATEYLGVDEYYVRAIF